AINAAEPSRPTAPPSPTCRITSASPYTRCAASRSEVSNGRRSRRSLCSGNVRGMGSVWDRVGGSEAAMARWPDDPCRPPAPGAAGPRDPARRADGGVDARASAGPARARCGARAGAARAARSAAPHPVRGLRRRAGRGAAAPAPAAAVRPARGGDRARGADPRPERAADRARRRRILRADAGGGRRAAAGPAAPPGPTTRRRRLVGGSGRRPSPRPRPRRRSRIRPRDGTVPGMSALYELPVFGLALTLTIYLLSLGLYHRVGRPGLLSPVLVTVLGVAAVLQLTGMPYALYMEQVALLALPLLRNGTALASSAGAVAAALVIGGVVSIAVTVGAMVGFGADEAMLRAALPRSVTSPVGLTIAETLGASVPMAVVLTLISG